MLDLKSELLENRIIFLTGHIEDDIAESIVSQLLYLENKDPKEDISLYINSPGGSITAGMAIYDTMNFIKCDVSTVCLGTAASMASFLLSAGAKGKRYALPNSEVMIHQPSGGAVGKTSDVMVQAEYLQRIKIRMINILSKNTNQTYETVEKSICYDNFMSAEEAIKFGLIDKII